MYHKATILFIAEKSQLNNTNVIVDHDAKYNIYKVIQDEHYIFVRIYKSIQKVYKIGCSVIL